jgi:hypothetical protein
MPLSEINAYATVEKGLGQVLRKNMIQMQTLDMDAISRSSDTVSKFKIFSMSFSCSSSTPLKEHI